MAAKTSGCGETIARHKIPSYLTKVRLCELQVPAMTDRGQQQNIGATRTYNSCMRKQITGKEARKKASL